MKKTFIYAFMLVFLLTGTGTTAMAGTVPRDTVVSDRQLVVMDTYMYQGNIKEVQKNDKNVSILVKQNQAGKQSLIFHINENTRINTENIDDLKEGQLVQVYYNGITTRSIPAQATAIAINILEKPQEKCTFKGSIKELKQNGNNISILVTGKHEGENPYYDEIIFHVSNDTLIKKGSEKDLQVGAKVMVTYSGAMAMSMPAQATAQEIEILKQPEVMEKVTFEGKVKEVNLTDNGMSILVDGKTRGENAFKGEAIFHINDNTLVKKGSREDLKVGAEVAVTYSGVMTMSIPGQATAQEIEICKKVIDKPTDEELQKLLQELIRLILEMYA